MSTLCVPHLCQGPPITHSKFVASEQYISVPENHLGEILKLLMSGSTQEMLV